MKLRCTLVGWLGFMMVVFEVGLRASYCGSGKPRGRQKALRLDLYRARFGEFLSRKDVGIVEENCDAALWNFKFLKKLVSNFCS